MKNIDTSKGSEINLGGRLIGPSHPPVVIAEIGINHGGSLEIALQMVDAASEAGVEVVKHQTHVIDDEMSFLAKKVIPGNSADSIYTIMEKCALSEMDELELKNYVESKGMIFISSAFSRAAANRLEAMNVPGYKIGSGECNNYPLIKHIAKFGKPIILSTGMNSIESIATSVQILRANNIPFALLHTTNLYPTPPHLVRLGAMTELSNHFKDAVIGLSDHTTNNYACYGAVALGASILERHFTDRMDRIGPDIVCSMDINACKELIAGSKIIHQELGGTKKLLEEERVTSNFAFATVVTTSSIKKGEQFTEMNIWVKRPGTGGIPAKDYEKVLGCIARRDIHQGEHLSISDVIFR